MNVRGVLGSSVVQAIAIEVPVYLPDIINALAKRYGFVTLPTTAAEFFPPENTPIVLSHGKYIHEGRTLLIRSVKLYNRAVIVETAGSTEDSEGVLHDGLECVASTIGQTEKGIAAPGTNRLYTSQLEIGLDLPFGNYFPMLQGVSEAVTHSLQQYGLTYPPMQVHSLSMNVDPGKTALICNFRIERRVGFAYELEIYFTEAPLKTSDHIAALEAFERAMKDAAMRLAS